MANTNLTLTATSSSIDDTKAFPELRKALKGDYPIIFNDGDAQIVAGKVKIDNGYLAFIAKIVGQFKSDPSLGLKANYFIVGQEFNTISVKLDSGLVVKLSEVEDWDKQIDNLLTLKKTLKADFYKKIKQKIDLRYGDKVYYE